MRDGRTRVEEELFAWMILVILAVLLFGCNAVSPTEPNVQRVGAERPEPEATRTPVPTATPTRVPGCPTGWICPTPTPAGWTPPPPAPVPTPSCGTNGGYSYDWPFGCIAGCPCNATPTPTPHS